MNDFQNKMFHTSLTFRGQILHVTIHIERKIDEFLANHFCKNDTIANELKEMLLMTDKITLGSKKEVLFLVLNRYYKEFIKKYPAFIDTLERFIPHRNILAHLEVDTSLDVMNEHEGLVFKRYKGGKLKIEKYGASEMEKINNDITVLDHLLSELLETTKAP